MENEKVRFVMEQTYCGPKVGSSREGFNYKHVSQILNGYERRNEIQIWRISYSMVLCTDWIFFVILIICSYVLKEDDGVISAYKHRMSNNFFITKQPYNIRCGLFPIPINNVSVTWHGSHFIQLHPRCQPYFYYWIVLWYITSITQVSHLLNTLCSFWW